MMRLVVAVMIAHRPGRHDTIGEDSMQFVEEDRGDVMGILHSRSEEVSAETVRRGHPPILPRGLTLSATGTAVAEVESLVCERVAGRGPLAAVRTRLRAELR